MSRVTVLLFAGARQRAGSSTLDVEIPDGSTVAELKIALASGCPALSPLLPSLRIAVNSEYAADESTIPPGAELAAIPPVSGGWDSRSSFEFRS